MSSEVKVKVGLIQGGIATGLAQIKHQFSEFRHELSGELGSLVAFGGLTAGIESMIAKGARLAQVSERFGAPAEELQRIGNVAEREGASLESVGKAWNKLAVNKEKAMQGNDEMRAQFAALGISMKDIRDMSVDQLFYKIADGTKDAGDRGAAYAAVVATMGRSAGELFTTLELGSTALRQQGDAMGVMSAKAIEKLDAMHEKITSMKTNVMAFGSEILIFMNNIVESMGSTLGSGLYRIEAYFGSIGKAMKSIGHGEFKAAVNIMNNADQEDTKIAETQREELKRIWTSKPEAHEEKKAVDREIEPSKNEEAHLEKIMSLRERLAELQRKTSNEALTAEEKITALKAQQVAALAAAGLATDDEKKLEYQIEATRLGEELIAAQKERFRDEKKEDRAPKISADSLRRVGGGGNAAVMSGGNQQLSEAKIHTAILKQIAAQTKDLGKPAPTLMKP